MDNRPLIPVLPQTVPIGTMKAGPHLCFIRCSPGKPNTQARQKNTRLGLGFPKLSHVWYSLSWQVEPPKHCTKQTAEGPGANIVKGHLDALQTCCMH